jgi:hypothetical protein
MKLLFSGNPQTNRNIYSNSLLLYLNGSADNINGTVDLGLSAGEAKKLTIAIYLANLSVSGVHNITVRSWLISDNYMTEYDFPNVVLQTPAGHQSAVISFSTFVHRFDVCNKLRMTIQSDNNGDLSVTATVRVFSDGFDKNSRVEVGVNADKTDYGLSAAVINLIAETLFTNGAANKLKIDAAGKVEAVNIEDIDAELLQKAAKMLLNKAVQDKLTGAIRYYDDDGETVMLTHTPVENESSMTRTPS